MRILLFTLTAAALTGCAAAGGGVNAERACRAQGYTPDTTAWRFCMDAGGAAVATSPGSPYSAWNMEE